MQQKEGSSHNLINHWLNFKLKIIFEGLVIGCIAGIVVVFYRFMLEKAITLSKAIYSIQRQKNFIIPIWIIILIIIGIIIGKIIQKEPMASGSGIPQVEGVLTNDFSMKWHKVILYKFIGGVLGILGGLSLGREGPSIQIGAAAAQGYCRLFKKVKLEEKFLITSGASAGLAAAFNAPLAGVIFSLEEIHKNFSPIVLTSSLAASITADFVSKNFFGLNPVFRINNLNALPLKYYPYVLMLGIILGLTGIVFNKSLLKTQDLYNGIGLFKKKPYIKPVLAMMFACTFGLLLPQVLGGGHEIVQGLIDDKTTIVFIMVLLLSKFIFTMISYGSGAPGGIFLPLLVVGALIGALYSSSLLNIGALNGDYIKNFIILAMAGYLTAIVKAPITGIILITEMTGSFQHILSIALVCLAAYTTVDVLKSKPIYEVLLDRMKSKGACKNDEKEQCKTLIELAVNLESILDGKRVKEIQWPKECLIVSIKRGEKEIIPKGEVRIKAGDYIVVLCEASYEREIKYALGELCYKNIEF